LLILLREALIKSISACRSALKSSVAPYICSTSIVLLGLLGMLPPFESMLLVVWLRLPAPMQLSSSGMSPSSSSSFATGLLVNRFFYLAVRRDISTVSGFFSGAVLNLSSIVGLVSIDLGY
jgi:hypothetical protein